MLLFDNAALLSQLSSVATSVSHAASHSSKPPPRVCMKHIDAYVARALAGLVFPTDVKAHWSQTASAGSAFPPRIGHQLARDPPVCNQTTREPPLAGSRGQATVQRCRHRLICMSNARAQDARTAHFAAAASTPSKLGAQSCS